VPKESIIFGIAGVFFGVLVGWMIGSQQARSTVVMPQVQQSAAEPGQAGQGQAAAPIDEARAAALRAAAKKDASDAAVRVELGDLYFDAERFVEASTWYEAALAVDPSNVNASTDLGIAYYYMNQPDRALAQFQRSLDLDSDHTKTLLNMGIVRAFGKQDLEGAATAWQRVVDVSPDSPEARMARQALQGLRSAHAEATSGARPAADTGNR
jgi:tetratricopeptide (TPR) repeat protein